MGSPEKCKTCGSDDRLVRFCRDTKYVWKRSCGVPCPNDDFHATPTPPAPADAVEEAAVREAFVAHMATVGVTDVAWTNALGPVGTRADHYGVMLSVEWERFAAGYRAALPARDDAVEEAAKRAYIVHGRALSPFPTYDHGAEWDRRRQYDGDRVVALWMDIARAALRREKGGA